MFVDRRQELAFLDRFRLELRVRQKISREFTLRVRCHKFALKVPVETRSRNNGGKLS